MGSFISFESNVTAALTKANSVTYNSPHASPGTRSALVTSMSSAVASPLPATTNQCLPPSISGLWSVNVTGTSMSVHWSTQVQSIQTFQVILSKTSEASELWETNMTMIELRGLQPGVLYNVTVTPCACGRQGSAVHMMVKTDAQSLDATTRLTNIEFNEDLRNSSSLAFKNLNKTFIQEIYQSLAPELKAMVESGQVRIEIQSFSLGSVVVNFSIIFNQSPGQAMGNLSSALLHALMNSSKFIVDVNNTSINDFDECTLGENDCSQWATCINTWASYTCICFDGFIDNNPERSGRNCQANEVDTTSTPGVSTISSTTTVPTFAQATTTSETTNPVLESSLYLGWPWCEVNGGNATHVELTVAWNECAIRLVNNETTYTASVTLFNTMDPYRAEGGTVEVPRIRLEVPIMCTYMKSMLISTDLGYMG
ncbi:hypothetical protein CHARACLAT_019390 [Characodon lateralis]|uniref:Uromodulin-like 1 n=1 Tax=Characodon lateralis TaxID=208331 RepID=A0ABU7D896_9TELE|nr:hypothetical protein [Characodon lateralis]